jgi:hypothetical protein
MFPIRDTIRSSTFPLVNTIIISINVVVFFIEILYASNLEAFIYTYGLVPARYSDPGLSSYFSSGQQLFSLVSFMFLHGGFLHLIGNMWFLYIFGDNIEDRLGHVRYILFYLLCGWASAAVQLGINFDSMIPTIGASGAVAGVMGAYLILFPRSRILTMILIVIIPYFIELPSIFFLAFWFIIQFVSASLSDVSADGIAWWAHVGGFTSGIIFSGILLIIPRTGFNTKTQKATTRQSTPRFQMARPKYIDNEPHLYGTITVTSKEAMNGTRKLVNIPGIGRKKFFFVNVPPGVSSGTVLRLPKMEDYSDSIQGDIYLNIEVLGTEA